MSNKNREIRATFKASGFHPFIALAASPRTPTLFLDFMFKTAKLNPFNNGVMPNILKVILANPNTNLNNYSHITRRNLVAAMARNSAATTEILDSLYENFVYVDDNLDCWEVLRTLRSHPNLRASAKADLDCAVYSF